MGNPICASYVFFNGIGALVNVDIALSILILSDEYIYSVIEYMA